MATFFNQASLSYGGTVTNSNITEGEILDALTLTKTAVTSAYSSGEGVVYAITLTNNGTTEITGVNVTDDLGAYTIPETALTVTPLSYVDGSLLYYQNGVLSTGATVSAGPPLSFSNITVPAGGNVTLLYETTANSFAPLAAGSAITNTASSTSCSDLTDSDTVSVRESAALTISKTVCPQSVSCGGEINYTFVVQNTGNLAVVATDNLVISDVFSPALNNITVTLNGTALAEGTGYTYDPLTGSFSTVAGVITVPAATYTTDPTTGVVTTTPGVSVLTVSGTV